VTVTSHTICTVCKVETPPFVKSGDRGDRQFLRYRYSMQSGNSPFVKSGDRGDRQFPR
jgi:hypothetical protein